MKLKISVHRTFQNEVIVWHFYIKFILLKYQEYITINNIKIRKIYLF